MITISDNKKITCNLLLLLISASYLSSEFNDIELPLYFISVLPSYCQECNKCRRVPLRCCALFDAWLGRSPFPR